MKMEKVPWDVGRGWGCRRGWLGCEGRERGIGKNVIRRGARVGGEVVVGWLGVREE